MSSRQLLRDRRKHKANAVPADLADVKVAAGLVVDPAVVVDLVDLGAVFARR